jgi:hypothetical protein
MLCASALCFASAFAATPQLARSASDPTVVDRRIVEPKSREAPLELIQPQRDPFVGERIAPESASNVPTIPVPVLEIPGSLRPLPANAGALGTPILSTQVSLRLQAVVSGDRPVALVVDSAGTHVVAVGDTVDGSTIVRIGRDGLSLSDGRSIALESVQRLSTQRVVAGPIPLVPVPSPSPIATSSAVPQVQS